MQLMFINKVRLNNKQDMLSYLAPPKKALKNICCTFFRFIRCRYFSCVPAHETLSLDSIGHNFLSIKRRPRRHPAVSRSADLPEVSRSTRPWSRLQGADSSTTCPSALNSTLQLASERKTLWKFSCPTEEKTSKIFFAYTCLFVSVGKRWSVL